MTDKQTFQTHTDASKATHEEHDHSGMALACHIWVVGGDSTAHEHMMCVVNIADLDASIVAAKASQRKEDEGPLANPQKYREGEIISDTSCSVDGIRNLLREMRARVQMIKKKRRNRLSI